MGTFVLLQSYQPFSNPQNKCQPIKSWSLSEIFRRFLTLSLSLRTARRKIDQSREKNDKCSATNFWSLLKRDAIDQMNDAVAAASLQVIHSHSLSLFALFSFPFAPAITHSFSLFFFISSSSSFSSQYSRRFFLPSPHNLFMSKK